ncbi:MAG: Type IV pilus assembly protein PilM [Candidatus Falkowbacteria bacterium GW2011_GWC2_38_22]|uniref:Type IV pilus assembly protein PilM n=1 Tax=Candidatus Falkowbacteria bacterium GW2011_GWE1_38_31 TaxID=1618638 RepID=A0A0G0JTH8_9BACT|nr:MAG: Type IV pilus assembly protein PilM [Candidatus Falkowbacteria bacterium GW2011_GWF2_38_1205]KKQ61110.1 MAG: Type IV pilus assembly protein PilM [Candidatus Falkowbacteria bacterium GW2011_GWC2_38_22]KKQ63180.1 MAG: Type IV pilus assembly protein PilM [Candidatus Falkowbacteria bacterium GW2011_GWF1_38_22]KKQ65375.1 MAG: Type IV pilus assembly protein PilM [Candidatus Falkowbacteria bacterium GW2011_GWE2_38_254]KKQ69952.1 MAG: Type IV pilus assembly protein PilM [Candidatus Falkowbacter
MALLSSSASYMGVDIGSTGIKIVELKKEGGLIKLVNYGFSESEDQELIDWQNNTAFAAKVINRIIKESGISSTSAVSALPTFSVFSSVLNLSNVSKKDMASAIHWEAKKVIPLPLEDMILDWKEIEEKSLGKAVDKNNFKVLLTGAPRVLVKKYIEIFKLAKINLLSLETETFSIIRSLLGNDKSTVMLVEIGAGTTDVSVVDSTIPILNRSIDVGGNAITKTISKNLNISLDKAEQFKYDLGVSAIGATPDNAPQIIIEAVSPIVNEIKYAINHYQSKSNKKIDKVVLSGGSALLPNLTGYLTKILDLNVIIGDPWARVSYPEDLRPLLQEIGPRVGVAIGLAIREIE